MGRGGLVEGEEKGVNLGRKRNCSSCHQEKDSGK